MSLCNSIDTLSMAFLDDELAAEERRELELHLLECASCRDRLDAERAELDLLRNALVAPPASALLKARITRALDAEDAAVTRQDRRRWSQWLLPGSAMAAAAAAIMVFVGVGTPAGGESSPVTRDVAKQQALQLPFEVQGASTGPWLRAHFAPVEPPQFAEPGIVLRGARLLPNGVAGHDAALLSYEVSIGGSSVPLIAFVLKDLRPNELNFGDAYRVGGLDLRLYDTDSKLAVMYADRQDSVGYVFVSGRLTAEELLRLVGSTDLISRAQQAR